MAITQYDGTGRRSPPPRVCSRAPASAQITVNSTRRSTRSGARPRAWSCQPPELTKLGDRFDVLVTVEGGGITGQSGAIRLGLSRALVEYDENLKSDLRKAGFLTATPARSSARSSVCTEPVAPRSTASAHRCFDPCCRSIGGSFNGSTMGFLTPFI